MPKRPSSSRTTHWLGIGFLLIGLLLAYFLVAFWPRTKVVPTRQQAVLADTAQAPAQRQVDIIVEEKAWVEDTHVLRVEFKLDADVRLLILVLLAGMLGSYVHAAQSFASYVGNASFKATWTWWYILRIPMGAALAVFVYFAIRGGLLAAGTTASGAANDLNLYGIVSFSGLAGLFSKQAADKLAEVFDTLFATKEGQQRGDKLGENPHPEVTSIDPNLLPAASGAVKIVLTGQGFVKNSAVKAAGKDLQTTYVSRQSLSAQIDPADFNGQKEIKITVVNPTPGGGESDPVVVKIQEADGGEGGDEAASPPVT
jgi:hypothetical protein